MNQHASQFQALVAEANLRVKDIEPRALAAKIAADSNVVLIDVRESEEWQSGIIDNAQCLSKGLVERDIEQICQIKDQPIIVYCSGGFRSVLVADNLQKMGYTTVYSLKGGLRSWIDQGFTLTKA